MNQGNAPKGYPQVEGGYQLQYALDLDGVPVPGIPPRLIYDQQTFADIAEINQYKARLEARKPGMDAEKYGADTPGIGYPAMSKIESDAALYAFDTAASDKLKWYGISQHEQYALQNRGMKRDEISKMIQLHSVGDYPEGWAESEVKKVRAV